MGEIQRFQVSCISWIGTVFVFPHLSHWTPHYMLECVWSQMHSLTVEWAHAVRGRRLLQSLLNLFPPLGFVLQSFLEFPLGLLLFLQTLLNDCYDWERPQWQLSKLWGKLEVPYVRLKSGYCHNNLILKLQHTLIENGKSIKAKYFIV